MSYKKIENRIKLQLPLSSVRFLELVNIEEYKAKRERERIFLVENPNRPITLISPGIYQYRTPALDSLDIIENELAWETPRASFIYLLDELANFNPQMKEALLFLSKCFRSDDPDVDIIKDRIINILKLKRGDVLIYNIEVYKLIIQIYLGGQRLTGLINKNERETKLRKELDRFLRFFSHYQNGIYRSTVAVLLKGIAKDYLRKPYIRESNKELSLSLNEFIISLEP